MNFSCRVLVNFDDLGLGKGQASSLINVWLGRGQLTLLVNGHTSPIMSNFLVLSACLLDDAGWVLLIKVIQNGNDNLVLNIDCGAFINANIGRLVKEGLAFALRNHWVCCPYCRRAALKSNVPNWRTLQLSLVLGAQIGQMAFHDVTGACGADESSDVQLLSDELVTAPKDKAHTVFTETASVDGALIKNFGRATVNFIIKARGKLFSLRQLLFLTVHVAK